MDNIKSSTNLIVQPFQLGGADASQPTTINDIIDKASKFPNDVKNAGVPIKVLLQDYKSLDLPDGANFIDIENVKDVLSQYSRLRSSYIGILNDLEFVKSHKDQFENVDDGKLQ